MKVLVTGASGLLGAEIVDVFSRVHETRGLMGRRELDLVSASEVLDFVVGQMPELIINCAGFRMIDQAEREAEKTIAINVLGTKNLARAADALDIPLVHFSSDAVFDGEADEPYHEFSRTNPINVYGYSKLKSEEQVRESTQRHFIVRVPLLFGPLGHEESNYIFILRAKLEAGERLTYSSDQICSPTYTRDVARALLEMTGTTFYGTYHVANEGVASRYEFYRTCASLMGLNTANISPILMKDQAVKRPRYTVFSSIAYTNTFSLRLGDWRTGLEDCMSRIKGQGETYSRELPPT